MDVILKKRGYYMNFFKINTITVTIALIGTLQSFGADFGGNIIDMPILVTYSPKVSGGKRTERFRVPIDVQNTTGKDLERILRRAIGISDADGVSLIWSDAGDVGRLSNYNEKIGPRALKSFTQREEEKKGLREQGTGATFIANVGPIMASLTLSFIDPVTWKITPFNISFDKKTDTVGDIIKRIKTEHGITRDINLYADLDNSISVALVKDAMPKKGGSLAQKPLLQLSEKYKPVDPSEKAWDVMMVSAIAQFYVQ